MPTAAKDWEAIAKKTKMVDLSPLVQVLVPALLVSTLSKSTRGVSFQGGRFGLLLGTILVGASLVMGWILMGHLGAFGFLVVFWLVGTTGTVMVVSTTRPLAFVKSICTRCRLLPIIVEHEAIHLSGVASDRAVWASMRERHSVESLRLETDPAICSFCPIPKRLREQ